MTTTTTNAVESKLVELLARWKELNFATQEIPFNPEWANQTGYFDHAVKDYALADVATTGTLLWSIDPLGRIILIAPTMVGNVVVFDRYANDPRSVVVSNRPDVLRPALPSSAWSRDDLDYWFGCPSQLPGEFVKAMAHSISVHQKRIAHAANASGGTNE